jgi:hypothetical protein
MLLPGPWILRAIMLVSRTQPGRPSPTTIPAALCFSKPPILWHRIETFRSHSDRIRWDGGIYAPAARLAPSLTLLNLRRAWRLTLRAHPQPRPGSAIAASKELRSIQVLLSVSNPNLLGDGSMSGLFLLSSASDSFAIHPCLRFRAVSSLLFGARKIDPSCGPSGCSTHATPGHRPSCLAILSLGRGLCSHAVRGFNETPRT